MKNQPEKILNQFEKSINNHTNSQINENKDLDDIELGLTTTSPTIEWSKENEMIMVEWCDIAQCYKWLSTKAHAKYSMMHAWMTIPAITLSTISGTASFAQASLPLSVRRMKWRYLRHRHDLYGQCGVCGYQHP